MAEWTGTKRTLNSITPTGAPPVDAASDNLPPSPRSPGATSSPQQPGETPDDPELPGRTRGSLPPLRNSRRPLTEYGTAQRMLRMFSPPAGADLAPSDWEQGPSAFEELRKAHLNLLPPFRPLEGYGLGIGRAAPAIAAEEYEAISASDEPVAPDPAVVHVDATAAPAPAMGIISPDAPPVPSGSVRGDGTATCPPAYPVKGNAQSMIYHTVESRVYEQTIPELCFATPRDAEAAGFRRPKND
jgi:hypothetical protein